MTLCAASSRSSSSRYRQAGRACCVLHQKACMSGASCIPHQNACISCVPHQNACMSDGGAVLLLMDHLKSQRRAGRASCVPHQNACMSDGGAILLLKDHLKSRAHAPCREQQPPLAHLPSKGAGLAERALLVKVEWWLSHPLCPQHTSSFFLQLSSNEVPTQWLDAVPGLALNAEGIGSWVSV